MDDNVPLRIRLSRYRCFFDAHDVELELERGKCVAIVGKNNTGKSALMRFFFEMRNILQGFSNGTWQNEVEGVAVALDTQSPYLHAVHGQYGIGDAVQLFPNQDGEMPLSFSFEYGDIKCEFLISKKADGYVIKKRCSQMGQSLNTMLQELFRDTLYIGAHRNLINQSGGRYYDLSVGVAFVTEWNGLKNGTDIEKANLAHRAEELVADILGWDSISINMSSDGTQLFVSTKGKRFALSELGAGVSELIVSLITAAIKRPSWIFIDEPESHLHPALQLKFLTALEQLARYGVVFTTHSIGLARAAADSIFAMQQDDHGRSQLRRIESARNYSELLGELQFSQFHELGFEKILLCEGVTEVKTLRQILRLWRMDSAVMLVPLGGSALIDPKRIDELSEFGRFGARIYVLVDSERSSVDKVNLHRQKFVTECDRLFGDGHAIQTERRAMENYFPQSAIRTAMKSEKYQELGAFEDSRTHEPFWGKNQNWRIAAELRKEDISGTDLGRFFDTIACG
ncbi:MAG: AAA family ATPase [Burkholderiales bacterium]